MDSSRRNLFKRFINVSCLAPLAGIASFEQNENGPVKADDKFPVVMTVKFYYSGKKSIQQIISDIKSWGNQEVHDQIFNTLVDQGLVSPDVEYIALKDHHQCKFFFKDKASCSVYSNMIKTSNSVNLEIQKKLGYIVKTEIS